MTWRPPPPTEIDTALTRMERQVLEAASRGSLMKETAIEFGISEETVRAHRKHLFGKLQAKNIAHAVAIGYQRRILSLKDVPKAVVH